MWKSSICSRLELSGGSRARKPEGCFGGLWDSAHAQPEGHRAKNGELDTETATGEKGKS